MAWSSASSNFMGRTAFYGRDFQLPREKVAPAEVLLQAD
jgi:hypothetical protein